MPLTMSITSSAAAAACWLRAPCRSAKRCWSGLLLTPPMPISLVTRIKVASCRSRRSSSLFSSPRPLGACGGVEQKVGGPQREAVYQHHTAPQVVAAQIALFLDVLPPRTATGLVHQYALAELVVPYMGRGQVDGMLGHRQGQLLGIKALARPLSSGYHNNVSCHLVSFRSQVDSACKSI